MPSTYYMDYVNGSDGNNGSSWALAKRTMNGFNTILVPGDTVRIAKSPDSTSLGITALWTERSKTITLASALTLSVEYCNSGFTAGANCTLTYPTADRKQGTADLKIATNASVTGAQKLAYKGLGSAIDFSGYQQVTFWVKILTGTTISAGQIYIALCSDTLGATVVDTINVPAIPIISTTQWMAFTVDKGSALGSSIQSVAIYCNASGYASSSIEFDNITACKASSSADSLSLTSLIGKNTGDEGWFAIQSIDGTTVLVDDAVATVATGGRGYYGVTETVTTYKRETIKLDMVTTSTTDHFNPYDQGSVANHILWKAGYNTSTTIQDGETFFDGQNGWGYGIQLGPIVQKSDYIEIENISFVKVNNGFRGDNGGDPSNYVKITAWEVSHCTGAGIDCNSSLYGYTWIIKNVCNNLSRGFLLRYCSAGVAGSGMNTTVTATNVNNNGNYGLYLTGAYNMIITVTNACNNITAALGQQEACYGLIATIDYANYNTTYGLFLGGACNQTFTCKNINNNTNYGIMFRASISVTITADNINSNNWGIYCDQGCYAILVRNANVKLNATGSVYYLTDGLQLLNCDMTGEALESYTGNYPWANFKLFSTNHNKDANIHKIFMADALIQSQQTTRHTASGIAWQLSPIADPFTNNYRDSTHPVKLCIARIACNASSLVTVKAWFRRDDTGITAKLICPKGQLPGLTSDAVSTLSAAANTWQELTITFTPTQQGVVEIEAWVYGGTTYSVFVDDLTISQA